MKNNTRYIAIGILVLLTVINISSFVSADGASTMEIKPNNFSVSQGESFDISLYVKLNAQADTIGVDHIDWDPSMATLDGVQVGDLFTDQTVWIDGKNIDNKNGTLDWMVWGSHTPSNGEGTFATLKFTALKQGTFSIYIPTDKMVIARDGTAITSSIIGDNSPVQKSTETFLPIGGVQVSQTMVFIVGAIIGLLIVSLVGIYLSKKKKRTAQATDSSEHIEK